MTTPHRYARHLAYVAQVARSLPESDDAARIAAAEKAAGVVLTNLEREFVARSLGEPATPTAQATAQQSERLATHEAMRQSNPVKAAQFYLANRADIDAAKKAPQQQ